MTARDEAVVGGDPGLGGHAEDQLSEVASLQPLPVTITENLVMYTLRPLNKPRAASPECRICQCNRDYGYGDNSGPIGLDRESLNTILGPGEDTGLEPSRGSSIEDQ